MRRATTLLVLAMLALAAAGCGGSKKSASETPASTTTTTTESSGTAGSSSTAESSTTTSGNTATTPVLASGKCKSLAAASEKIGKDLRAASQKGKLQDVAKEFQEFANSVPSEIRGDVQTIAAAITKYADALKGADLTPGKTSAADLQKLQAAIQSIDQPKLQAAETHIEAWAKKNCT